MSILCCHEKVMLDYMCVQSFMITHTECFMLIVKDKVIRASIDTLCRDGAVQISRERVQRGRLTRQETTS